jgi:murein hydrolase activator
VILANLADLIVRTGDAVSRGAPLGILGGRSPGVEEYVRLTEEETGSGLREALYIEVRDGGGPIDPVSWLDGKNG